MFAVFGCSKPEHRFTLIGPDHSNVTFTNRIDESDSFNLFTFEYLYNGGGVGIGDFNNDGLQDIYFTGNMVSSKLYLNRGEFRFEDITDRSGTATNQWCTGVAVIDINQDGLKDIYVSSAFSSRSRDTSHNLLFLNKGINDAGVPRFEEKAAPMGLMSKAYHTQSAFFDYDRDGDLDVYLCINSFQESDRNQLRQPGLDQQSPSRDRLLRNEGINRNTGLPFFTDVSTEAGITKEGWGLGLIIKDFNRDGWQDIYVANDFQSNDQLYINNADGTFTNQIDKWLAHQSHNSMGIDMADFNNDGYEDLCVVDMLPEDNLRQKAMFSTVPNDRYAAAIRLGYQPQFVRNMLQLNTGLIPDSSSAPAFSDIGYLAGIAATDWSWTPLWIDYDLDGWKDLLITNGYGRDITDQDFATFSSEYSMFGKPADRLKTLLGKMREMPEVKKPNYLFHNNTDLTFMNVSMSHGMDQPSITNGAAYADFDNDGDWDLAMNNLNSKAFIYRNNTISNDRQTHRHYASIKLVGDSGNIEGIGATVSIWSGGRMQYVEHALQRGYLSTVDDRIYFGVDSLRHIDSLVVVWPSGKSQKLLNIETNKQTTVYERNADTRPRLKVRSEPTRLFKAEAGFFDYQHKENEFLDFQYQFTLPHRYSMQGPGIAVADVNGDLLDDFYVGGASRHSGYLFLQNKTGFSSTPLIQNTDQKLQEETGVLFFDAENDGDQDLYCVGGGNEFQDDNAYSDLLLVNDGKGKFSKLDNALPTSTASGSCVVAADFDNDGDLDLFVGGRSKPRKFPIPDDSYLLRNDSKKGTVKFTDVTAQYCAALRNAGLVTSALWTDIDNDSYVDLIVVGEFMSVTVFKNEKGKKLSKLAPAGLANTNGWYNSITGGDFDNDGDVDYVAGNLGLNSKYRASPKEPVTVRANDFNKDGALDAFLFAFNQQNEFPVHTRTTMIEQIPALRKRVYTFHQYGKSGYEQLFTEDERKHAVEWKAEEMRSLYIENQGNFSFRVSALPVAAQISPTFGIVPVDVDADGLLDIVAIGNSYAPDALTGRYDASPGYILKGGGDGTFSLLPAQQTGFAISGDTKALALLNFNGNAMLIASRNQGALSARLLSTAHKTVRPASEVNYAIHHMIAGRRRKEEIYRGSGYFSQSSRMIITNNATVSLEQYPTLNTNQ
jgi:enediyne biosynthesis protein E4